MTLRSRGGGQPPPRRVRIRGPATAALVAGALLGQCLLALGMGAGPTAASPHTRAGEVTLASATFAPCSMLTWAYNPDGATAKSQALASDIVVALELVSARTGLRFVPASSGRPPDLAFAWATLSDYPEDTQAIGWASGVTFAIGAEMTADVWSGFGRKSVRRQYGSFDVGVGRGWLVVHEILHSLGLGHSDEPGSVMAPTAKITNVLGRRELRREMRSVPAPGFSPGDIANLSAMYPRAGCPA